MAGSFSLGFGSFSPITRPSYPHIKDKMTEIARNSPILRSDCLQEFRPFPVYKGLWRADAHEQKPVCKQVSVQTVQIAFSHRGHFTSDVTE